MAAAQIVAAATGYTCNVTGGSYSGNLIYQQKGSGFTYTCYTSNLGSGCGCSGGLTFTCTWPTGTTPPAGEILQVTSNAEYHGSQGSGTADDGHGDPSVWVSGTGTSGGTWYVPEDGPGGSITFTISPSASASSPSGSTAYVQVTITPIDINLALGGVTWVGTNPSVPNIAIGQPFTATVQSGIANVSDSYAWSSPFPYQTSNPFVEWTQDTPANYFEALQEGSDLTGQTLSCMFAETSKDKMAEEISCTYTSATAGETVNLVYAGSQLLIRIPSVTTTNTMVSGDGVGKCTLLDSILRQYVFPSNQPAQLRLWGIKLYQQNVYPVGIALERNVTDPTDFSGGQFCFFQIFEPGSNNGHPQPTTPAVGLDTSFPYSSVYYLGTGELTLPPGGTESCGTSLLFEDAPLIGQLQKYQPGNVASMDYTVSLYVGYKASGGQFVSIPLKGWLCNGSATCPAAGPTAQWAVPNDSGSGFGNLPDAFPLPEWTNVLMGG